METTTHSPNVRPSFPFRVRFVCLFKRHLASKNRKVSLAERRLLSSVFFAVVSVRPTWMCSIAVLSEDLISSFLSMRSWCRCLRIIHLLAQSLGLIHPQSASTALRRQFINGDKSPRQLSISSVVSLRAFETFTWSRATCRSSVMRQTPSQTVRTLSFVSFASAVVCALMRSLLMSCIMRSKVPPETSCLRRLALCEIWPASLNVPRPSPSTSKSCSRKALWACIDVFCSLFSQTDEVVSPKVTAEGLNTRSAKHTTTVGERRFLAPSRSLPNLVARYVPSGIRQDSCRADHPNTA